MSRKWTHYDYNLPAGERDTDTGVTIEWEESTGGYDWECWALVSKDNGELKLYASYVDSGCSCRGPFEEKPEEYDFAWTPNLKEAASQLSRSIRDIDTSSRWSDMSADDKASMLASLSQTVMKLR